MLRAVAACKILPRVPLRTKGAPEALEEGGIFEREREPRPGYGRGWGDPLGKEAPHGHQGRAQRAYGPPVFLRAVFWVPASVAVGDFNRALSCSLRSAEF